MKLITGLRGRHAGKDIYVVASGNSVEYINPNFFNNKVTIGVNHIFKRFPSLNYFLCKEHITAEYLNSLGVEMICSEYDCGIDGGTRNEFPSWYFKHKDNKTDTFEDVFDLPGYLTVSWSTITSAIHLAYYMGARNIILCGHDCGLLDNKSNVENYHYYGFTPDEYHAWLGKIEAQTVKLREMINARGVNIYSLNPFLNFGLEGHTYTR